MQTPLISIIVPVYNVEPYLRRCLDSIVNQTYTNLEIILIDDGSPDNCPKICDEYAAKDKRITVIHKKNGGLSDARNAGLDICKGEYVSFVDSDDWIANTYVELLTKAIIDNNADISVCEFIRTTQTYNLSISSSNIKYEVFDSTTATKKLWSENYITFVIACGKLLKRTLFSNIRFPKGFVHEDVFISYKFLYNAHKTIFLSIPLYCYFQRKDSIMGNARPSSVRALKAYVERYEFFKEHNETELSKLCLNTLCWDLLYAYAQLKQGHQIQGFTKAKDILTLFQNYQKDYCNFDFPLFSKICFKIFAIFPISYVIYQKLSPIKVRKI